jgi:hypothetical protein
MKHPFDEFSKSLAEEKVPRRESLRRLGAILAGAVLGPLALGLETASAKSEEGRHFRLRAARKPRAPKDPCQSFCKGCTNKKKQTQCLTACRACGGDTSRLCGYCGSYACTDLSSDPNCGACGNDCGAFGQTCCGGHCADLSNDANNCGACGNACGGSAPYCINGTCSQCPPGLTKCGNSCVYILSDPNNCGACGNVCSGVTSYCSGGVCGENPCPGGGTFCGGVCTNVAFDPQNCGGCGVVCAPGETCSGGVCQSPF